MNAQPDQNTTEPPKTAWEKAQELAESVEKAKFALGLKGYFTPEQTGIGAILDEIIADVPYTVPGVPVFYKEPEEETIERAAKAGVAASGGHWDELSDEDKAQAIKFAKAAMTIKK